jgi:hypothetical protein
MDFGKYSFIGTILLLNDGIFYFDKRMIKMLKTIISYIPSWPVFFQTFIVFFIPYLMTKLFNWIQTSKEEWE